MHYTGSIWRPPYEAYSALIQVTAGCTHNACKFCTLYEDVPFKFRMSPLSEVEQDLQELSSCYPQADRIFFTGANPFILSTDKLKTLANMVKKYLSSTRLSDVLLELQISSQNRWKNSRNFVSLDTQGLL